MQHRRKNAMFSAYAKSKNLSLLVCHDEIESFPAPQFEHHPHVKPVVFQKSAKIQLRKSDNDERASSAK
jgi:hypothetical protein